MKAIGIIPARYASSRLPGKALAEIGGKSMIQRVYERASGAESLAEVWVATDDEGIRQAVAAFGGRVVLTRPDHPSGTDRIAEAARGMDADVVVNVQGDEPLLDPAGIDAVVRPFQERPDLVMTTLVTPISDPVDMEDPAVVKAVVDREGFALYFSRHPIPFYRARPAESRLKHVGLYAYRRGFLLEYASLPPTPLEEAECLEQLRVLEHGYRIFAVRSDHDAVSVDTPEDLERVRRLVVELEA